MGDEYLHDLKQSLAKHGFQEVQKVEEVPDVKLLLKRQNLISNRAIIVVSPENFPDNINDYLKLVRKRVAFRCGFFPVLWGIGIQVIVVSPRKISMSLKPIEYVAKVDNQWSIIQSFFVVDIAGQTFQAGRTWGQFWTGKFQDAIYVVLSKHFTDATRIPTK